MFVIASYPRSGNHLVRFAVEYLTGRQTLGAPWSPSDLPICRNNFPTEPDVLRHVGDRPAIAHKAHWVEHVRAIAARYPIEGIVLVRRDPVEVILAQTARPETDVLSMRYHSRIVAQARLYFSLQNRIREWGWPVLDLTYEALVSRETGIWQAEIERLAGFLAPHVDPSRLDLLLRDFDRLRAVNAAATGRVWHGINSNGEIDYHRKRAGLAGLAALTVSRLATAVMSSAATG